MDRELVMVPHQTELQTLNSASSPNPVTTTDRFGVWNDESDGDEDAG